MPPQATYLFKHALIQDAAYQSLLKSTRQQYHQRIAQVLEARFPEIGETQPELLAHHYTEAGLIEQAIPYWQQAGQRPSSARHMRKRSAHLTKGLEVLATLPDTLERAQQELDLQIALGPALMATKGYAAPEVERAYARARELCQQVGETPQLFPVLWGLWVFMRAGRVPDSAGVGEQLLTLAQRDARPGSCSWRPICAGEDLVLSGRVRPRSVPIWSRAWPSTTPSSTTLWPVLLWGGPWRRAAPLCGLDLWLLGYPDQALQRSHEALTPARELRHPYQPGNALSFAAVLHQLRREGTPTQERAEAIIAVRPSRDFRSGWRGARSCGAGLWLPRARRRRAWRRYARVWPPGRRRGRGRTAVLAGPAGRGLWEIGQAEEGLQVWPRRWRLSTLGSASMRQSCIGSRASYC